MVTSDWDDAFENWKRRQERAVVKEVKAVENVVKQDVEKVEEFVKKEEKLHPILFKVLHILAWVIPILIVLAIFYINFLPFGYSKSYTINVLESGEVVTSSSQVWLEDVKGKKISNLSDIYSYGSINLVVSPKVVLRGANVSISVNGTDVYLADLDFSVKDNSWDYFWNFSEGVSSDLKGTAKFREDLGCVYFNGSNNETLYYPNSSDMFEDGSFIVYAKWKPEDNFGNGQQIVGHLNWEVLQYNDSIRFRVGRLNDYLSTMKSIFEYIEEPFFNKTHFIFAIYQESYIDRKGYIDLYLDNLFIARESIYNYSILNTYNLQDNLSFGKFNSSGAIYFTGCLYEAGFDYGSVDYFSDKIYFAQDNLIKIPLAGKGNLSKINLEIKK